MDIGFHFACYPETGIDSFKRDVEFCLIVIIPFSRDQCFLNQLLRFLRTLIKKSYFHIPCTVKPWKLLILGSVICKNHHFQVTIWIVICEVLHFPICSQISGGRISKNRRFLGRIFGGAKQNLDFQQFFDWKVCLKSNSSVQKKL